MADLADPVATLDDALLDARQRTLALIADLGDDPLRAPPESAVVNPMLWEIGHVAWFQERWTCRRDGAASLLERADGLYDSIAVPHEVRWTLALPDRGATLWYAEAALERARERLRERGDDPEERFHQRYALAHEDMHAEAFAYMRQTLGWPAPRLGPTPNPQSAPPSGAPIAGDARLPGGRWTLGDDAAQGEDGDLHFDNERPALTVDVAPFAIARAPVTQREYREFVDAGGYRRDALWSDAGLAWRRRSGREHPRHWRHASDGRWERREFDRWVPLEDDLPACFLSCYEAEAWCRFAGRRLPTEAEWEMAALLDPASGRRFTTPFAGAPVDAARAHADGRAARPARVADHPASDSPSGCRQMLGNVWEWTADWFLPHPGFTPDPYLQYSMPAFGFARVLKGGSFLTRHRLLRAGYRNFFPPTRDDVPAGFRTCAIDA